MPRNLIIPIFFHCWCYWSSSSSIPSSFIIFFKSSWVVWVFKAQAYELSRPGVTIKPVQDKDTPLPYIMCVDPRQFPQARVFSRFVLVFRFVLFWFRHEPGSKHLPSAPSPWSPVFHSWPTTKIVSDSIAISVCDLSVLISVLSL